MSSHRLTPRGARASEALVAANVLRLMARENLTLDEAALATDLDRRTLRSILHGKSRPQARTLYKLARGLNASVDELFEPAGRRWAELDRTCNRVAARVVRERPEMFADWTLAEFDELYSRVGVGGPLTEEGAVAAANAMNGRRELLTRAAVVLETDLGDLLREFIDLLFRRVAVGPHDKRCSAQPAVGRDA